MAATVDFDEAGGGIGVIVAGLFVDIVRVGAAVLVDGADGGIEVACFDGFKGILVIVTEGLFVIGGCSLSSFLPAA